MHVGAIKPVATSSNEDGNPGRDIPRSPNKMRPARPPGVLVFGRFGPQLDEAGARAAAQLAARTPCTSRAGPSPNEPPRAERVWIRAVGLKRSPPSARIADMRPSIFAAPIESA